MAQIILFINQFVAFAVYDVMRRLKCPIITINTGLTVGMGALLCSVGSPGQRSAWCHSVQTISDLICLSRLSYPILSYGWTLTPIDGVQIRDAEFPFLDVPDGAGGRSRGPGDRPPPGRAGGHAQQRAGCRRAGETLRAARRQAHARPQEVTSPYSTS